MSGPDALDLPDKIEEINAKQLEKLINDKMFMAVFFCEYELKVYPSIFRDQVCQYARNYRAE